MTPQSSDIEVLLKLWPIFVSVILLVSWLIRLESRSLTTKEKLNEFILASKKDLDDHKEDVKHTNGDVWKKFETIQQQNTKILQSLSRLEGQLNSRKGVHNEVS